MEIGNYAGVKIIVTSEQYDKCKKKIDSSKDYVVNDLLKRISNLEFDVEEKDRRINRAIELIKEKCSYDIESKDIYFDLDIPDVKILLNVLQEEIKK